MSDKYLVIDERIFSEGGLTICFGSDINPICREQDFIDDQTLTPKETSQALCGYFIHGRFREDIVSSSEEDRAATVSEMEGWIQKYGSYLESADMEAVKAHREKIREIQ